MPVKAFALQPPISDPDEDELVQVEIAHELTRFRRATMARRSRRIGAYLHDARTIREAASAGDSDAGPIVEALPETALPEMGLAQALAGRRSASRPQISGVVTPDQMAVILALAARSNLVKPALADGSAQFRLRSYPSAGALFPCQLYVLRPHQPACRYDATGHALVPVAARAADFAAVEAAPPGDSPPLALVITGVFARAMKKYGGRGYRFAMLEAGHIGQNLVLAATALGLPSLAYGSYYDDELERLLGVDGVRESVLAVVLVGANLSETFTQPEKKGL